LIFYFDVSALHRPFDDQTQPRVRLESEAVLLLLDHVKAGRHQHVSSEIAIIEIDANTDPYLRRRLHALLPRDEDMMPLAVALYARAVELGKLGFKPADALHVASAEEWTADVLFSCDDKLCKIAKRNIRRLHVRVMNPLTWVEETLR
jgi:predicted nucleic acid-binding protein